MKNNSDNKSFVALVRILQAMINESRDQGILIWDQENPEFAVVDLYYDDEADKIFLKYEEVDQ
jgi:hypothetical protein